MSAKPSTENINKSLLILHATVFVWGFTGILGNLISINAIHLVWFRVLIASISFLIYFKIWKINFAVSRKQLLSFALIGGVVGLHWILFFYSIKASTVSVALVCLSATTLFTAFVEPLLKGHKISILELGTGLAIICGIVMIFKFETQYTTGIICGLAAALCASIFSTVNSQFVQKTSPVTISFYEMAGAFIWISIYLLVTGTLHASDLKLSLVDSLYLLLLGTFCTSIAYAAGVSVMKHLTAFRVALITNLEPVYGIILAFLFFGKREEMSIGFYIGAFIILSSISLYPVLKNKLNK